MIKLKGLVKEIQASSLRKLCNKRKSLNEVATGFTEVVHEVFTAMALGGCGSPTKDFSDMDSSYITKWVNKGGKLTSKSLHSDALIDQLENNKSVWDSKASTLWSEGESIGDLIKSLYLSKDYTMTGTSRVFNAGDSGKKVIADVVIEESGPGGKQTLSVSLKAGKHAQFTNLSPGKIQSTLFPNVPGPKEKEGLLGWLYENGYKKNLDQGFQAYLKFVLRNYHRHREQILKQGKVKSKHEKILDKLALHKGGGYIGDIWVKKQTWKKNWMGGGASKDTKDAFKYAYRSQPLTKLKKTYENSKKHLINGTITKHFGDAKNISQEGIKELLIYVLRADETDSYLYAGSSGKKLSFLPSAKEIRKHKFDLEFKSVSSADYVVDVIVSVGGNTLFEFDLKYRFAGAGGQWTTDLSHKGSKFNIFESFWTTFTGVPIGRWS